MPMPRFMVLCAAKVKNGSALVYDWDHKGGNVVFYHSITRVGNPKNEPEPEVVLPNNAQKQHHVPKSRSTTNQKQR